MAFADQRIDTTRQCLHHIAQCKRRQQRLNPRAIALAVLRVEQGDVFANRGVKQNIFLALQADGLRQLLTGDRRFPGVAGAALRRKQPGNQPQQRALARAGFTNNRNLLARR